MLSSQNNPSKKLKADSLIKNLTLKLEAQKAENKNVKTLVDVNMKLLKKHYESIKNEFLSEAIESIESDINYKIEKPPLSDYYSTSNLYSDEQKEIITKLCIENAYESKVYLKYVGCICCFESIWEYFTIEGTTTGVKTIPDQTMTL